MPANDETPDKEALFDFDAFPADTLFLDRRTGADRRDGSPRPERKPVGERRARPERRRRVDPTTFEKQYSDQELEFMNAIQRFKTHHARSFPTHREVLQIATMLGYRKDADTPSHPLVPLQGDPDTPN